MFKILMIMLAIVLGAAFPPLLLLALVMMVVAVRREQAQGNRARDRVLAIQHEKDMDAVAKFFRS